MQLLTQPEWTSLEEDLESLINMNKDSNEVAYHSALLQHYQRVRSFFTRLTFSVCAIRHVPIGRRGACLQHSYEGVIEGAKAYLLKSQLHGPVWLCGKISGRGGVSFTHCSQNMASTSACHVPTTLLVTCAGKQMAE